MARGTHKQNSLEQQIRRRVSNLSLQWTREVDLSRVYSDDHYLNRLEEDEEAHRMDFVLIQTFDLE